jgi:hypothetical protein
LSRTSVAFTANEGDATPAAQQVTVSVTSGTVFIATAGGGGAAGFTQSFALTNATSGTVTILPYPTSPAGTFTNQISVRGCAVMDCSTGDVVGSPQTITVSYTITPAAAITATPGVLLFNAATGAASAAQPVSVGIASGSGAWTSNVTYGAGLVGWLAVTPPSGAFPATASVSTNAVVTPGTYTATLEFAAGASKQSVPVTLVVIDPAVSFVAPYIATSSRAGSVILRGRGFSTVSAGLQVDFGGTAATAKTYVGDTEIRASYPPLAAGSYDVHVRNGGATLATRAKLVVVDPPGYAAATIARIFQNPSAAPLGLIYDDERKSIYLIDNDRNRLEAYRFTNGAWSAEPAPFVDGTQVLSNHSIALSPDGTEILKTSSDRLWRVDPSTGGQFASPGAVPAAPVVGGTLNFIAFANDGGAIGTANDLANGGTTLYRYDLLAQKLTPVSQDAVFNNRYVFASRDGATVLIPTLESLRADLAKPVFKYDPSSGSLTALSVKTTDTQVTMDRAASRIVMVSAAFSAADQTTTVYDASFNEIGKLPKNLGLVLSPDGTKAYGYFAATAATGIVRKFDLTAPLVAAEFPGDAGTPVPDALGTAFLEMTISADGGTLFLAGNQKLAVMPAP